MGCTTRMPSARSNPPHSHASPISLNRQPLNVLSPSFAVTILLLSRDKGRLQTHVAQMTRNGRYSWMPSRYPIERMGPPACIVELPWPHPSTFFRFFLPHLPFSCLPAHICQQVMTFTPSSAPNHALEHTQIRRPLSSHSHDFTDLRRGFRWLGERRGVPRLRPSKRPMAHVVCFTTRN